MALFKNYPGILFASVVLILGISLYFRRIKKYLREGFEGETSCSLDCTNKELLAAVKKEFESRYVEGFTDGSGNEYTEAFQDPSQLLSLVSKSPQLGTLSGLPGLSTNPQLTNLLSSGQPDVASLAKLLNSGTASLPGVAPIEEPKYKISRNKLKSIRRALKVDDMKCEYNIVYDESNMDVKGSLESKPDSIGYIQVKFVKQGETGCFFVPREVKLLVGPEIVRNDTLNPENPIPELNYVF
jgi:hypothetical protein